jgi:hypothetical protein
MKRGPLTYLSLIFRTAWRHSFHAAHSVILVLIILAGLVTYFVPRAEVMVDPHGWRVAIAVLGAIISVRLLLAPYWIWRDDKSRLSILNDRLVNEARDAARRTERTTAIDDIADEIEWAVNNLVNPKPWPLSTADPESAVAAFKIKFDAWCSRVSEKLENRDVFTHGDQIHFDNLGFVTSVHHTGHIKLDSVFSQLNLKIARLRKIEHRARERK